MRSLVGKVTSNKMQKSVVVAVDRFRMHSKYPKVVRTTKKFMAHDEEDQCSIGDKVRTAWQQGGTGWQQGGAGWQQGGTGWQQGGTGWQQGGTGWVMGGCKVRKGSEGRQASAAPGTR